MIMSDYMKIEVEEYCKSMEIPMIRGKVRHTHIKEVEIFIHDKMKSDRIKTRKIEQGDKAKLSNIINIMVGGFNKCESPIEEFMFQAIKNAKLALDCEPQFQIGTKRVDFAFPKSMLVVECDGKEYHFTDEGQIERDQQRDKYLSRKGWRVLHFEGLVIRRKIELCIEKIKKNLFE